MKNIKTSVVIQVLGVLVAVSALVVAWDSKADRSDVCQVREEIASVRDDMSEFRECSARIEGKLDIILRLNGVVTYELREGEGP